VSGARLSGLVTPLSFWRYGSVSASGSLCCTPAHAARNLLPLSPPVVPLSAHISTLIVLPWLDGPLGAFAGCVAWFDG